MWTYRVFKDSWTAGNLTIERYGFRECFMDGNGKIFACTKDFVEPVGDDLNGLKESLDWMQKALEKPVLTMENIPEEGAENPCPTEEDIKDIMGVPELKNDPN